MELILQHANSYDGTFPVFREPSEIGCFSLDDKRKYHDNNNQLKYIIKPPTMDYLSMDLNVGYHSAIRKDFGKNEKIDTLLTWILNNQNKVCEKFRHPTEEKLNIDFVCFRGLLTTIWPLYMKIKMTG